MPSLYKRRLEAGLCGGCGEPKEGTTSLCSLCKEKARKRAIAKTRERQKKKLCLGCGEVPAVSGKSRCEGCAEKQCLAQKLRIKKRKAAGLCQGCGKVPPKPDCTLCQVCITGLSKNSSEYYRRRKAAGLCGYCGKPPEPGYSMCPYHRSKYAGYRQKVPLPND